MIYTNKAIITGKFAGATPIRTFNNVDSCTISVETETSYRIHGSRVADVEIHHVLVRGKDSHYCQRIRKGVWIRVEGKIRSSYNDILAEELEWERLVGQEIL